MFSGGIDSGPSRRLDHLLRRRGQSPSRLKAFTLAVDGNPSDSVQACQFLQEIDREIYLEVVDVPREDLSWRDAITSLRTTAA